MATKTNSTSKKSSAATTKKTAPAKQAEVAAVKAEPVAEKKELRLDDNIRVVTQSNVYGKLVFVNPRNGDTTRWSDFGDYQIITMGDLRAMRGTSRGFFENNWVFVDHIDEPGYEDVDPFVIYKALSVAQYYEDAITPNNFPELFNLSTDELKVRLRRLSESGKTNIIVAANEAILAGTLDSLRVIQTIEETLNCELVQVGE